MKKQKSLSILAGVTLVLVVAAIFSVKDRSAANASPEEHGKLFEGLREKVNEVTEVSIQKGADIFTLARNDDGWGLAERGGYPAKAESVKEVVMKVAELTIEEPKTSRPENYSRLGVQDAGEGSESMLITIRKGTEELASVIVGDALPRRGAGAVFVRREGDAQSFQCSGRLTAATDVGGWIDKEILKVAGERVQKVRIVHADGEEIVIERGALDESKFELANMPEGRELQYDGVCNSVATSLSYLALDDVKPVGDVDLAAAPVATAEFHGDDGYTVILQMSKVDEVTWARVSAQFNEPAPVEGPAPPPVEGEEGEPAPEEPATVDHSAVIREVNELNERLSPWAFALPDFKATNIAKRMEDLLQEVEEPEETPTDPPADTGDPTQEDG